MRTPVILIAATLFLTATAASAGPRSLSTGEPQPVQLPASKVQVLEAPRVELAPPAPVAQTAPVQSAPAPTAPAPALQPTETAPVAATPAPTAPVEAKAVESAPVVKPVRQAQRKPRQHHAGVEQRIHRELRGIERTIGISIGYAIAGSSLYW